MAARSGAWRARALRQLTVVMLVACIVTPIFNILTVELSWRQAIQGLVDAILLSVLVGGYLLFVREGVLRGWFLRLRFTRDFALSSVIVLTLFLVGRAAGQVITTGNPRRFVASFIEGHLVLALPFFVVVTVAVQFVLQMNRIVGANVLRYFATGAYHRPKAEERVFLFLDLEGSTQLAERLGSERYFELLRRVVDDLTDPVLEAEGEIYQYAGDEVVITWPLARGVRAANCVRCFFAVRAVIAAQADRYRGDFGVVPRFRGGLHGGRVTGGELGICAVRSCSSGTSSTRRPGWRSTPSVPASTWWHPGRSWSGSHYRPAWTPRAAATSRCAARKRPSPPTASKEA
jgi:adenylate cyclase